MSAQQQEAVGKFSALTFDLTVICMADVTRAWYDYQTTWMNITPENKKARELQNYSTSQTEGTCVVGLRGGNLPFFGVAAFCTRKLKSLKLVFRPSERAAIKVDTEAAVVVYARHCASSERGGNLSPPSEHRTTTLGCYAGNFFRLWKGNMQPREGGALEASLNDMPTHVRMGHAMRNNAE